MITVRVAAVKGRSTERPLSVLQLESGREHSSGRRSRTLYVSSENYIGLVRNDDLYYQLSIKYKNITNIYYTGQNSPLTHTHTDTSLFVEYVF